MVLDTMESLFSGIPNERILRSEIRRLFRWLKERDITTVVTAERGTDSLTRHGLEEYISDCVILLDHRVTEQLATRRMRVLKYRGSAHSTNEFPFLIDAGGISILPITSAKLDYRVSTQHISTGVPQMDAMFAGGGYFRGSSILISGSAGTGKTSFAARFVEAACSRGEHCLYFAFEESDHQIVRNMRSIGIDLEPWSNEGLLQFHAGRPSLYGLETHLAGVQRAIQQSNPTVVVVDPISNLTSVGSEAEVKSLLVRLVDIMKERQITSIFVNLSGNVEELGATEIGISSIMDTWVLLRSAERADRRVRQMQIVKARGMDHSDQIAEFKLSSEGIGILDGDRACCR